MSCFNLRKFSKDDPFFMIKNNSDADKNLTGNDRYHGFCVDLAHHIAKIVNFSYEFRMVKDNRFGARGEKFLFNMNLYFNSFRT